MKKPKRGGWVWRGLIEVAEMFICLGEAIIDIAVAVTDA